MTAVIFDLDGVLVESERHWQRAFADIANQQAKDRGWAVPELAATDLVKYTGGRVHETLRDIFNGMGHREVAADDVLIDELTRRAVDHVCREFLADPEPIAASVEVARALARSGVTLGVASSSSEQFIETVLDYLDLSDFVSVSQSGLYLDNGKPSGDVYRLTLERLGEPPAECVAVEDSAAGVQAAADAHLRCIGLYTGDPDSRPAYFDSCVVITSRLTMADIIAAFEAADPYSPTSRGQRPPT